MSKAEILNTTVAEMGDMINCYAVQQGTAKPKRRLLSIDDILNE